MSGDESDIKFLTKADLLRGPEPVEVEIEGKGKVMIRPLTDGEYEVQKATVLRAFTAMADMEAIQKRMKEKQVKAPPGQQPSLEGIQINFDLGAFTGAEYEAHVFVCTCGLSVGKEKWTAQEVRRLSPPGLVGKIATEIYRISGIETPDELVKSFRPQ